MAIRHFQKGKSTYTCRTCGKLTRDTQGEGGDIGLCLACYDLAGYENSILDGHISPAAARAEVLGRKNAPTEAFLREHFDVFYSDEKQAPAAAPVVEHDPESVVERLRRFANDADDLARACTKQAEVFASDATLAATLRECAKVAAARAAAYYDAAHMVAESKR